MQNLKYNLKYFPTLIFSFHFEWLGFVSPKHRGGVETNSLVSIRIIVKVWLL